MDGMEYQDSFDMDLCKVCGKRHIDRSTGRVGEFMCRECRAEYSKLKVPKWLVACIVLVCAVALAMIIYLGKNYGNFTVGTKAIEAGDDVIKQAQDLIAEHRQWSAFVVLEDYLTENPSNAEVALEAVRMAMEVGMYDNAAYFENTYLLDKGFTEDELKELNGYNDILDRYYDTYDAIDAIFEELYSHDMSILSEEQKKLEIKKTREKLIALTKDDRYEKGLIYYSLMYVANDESEADSYLRQSVKYKPVTAQAAAIVAKIERNKGNFGAAESWIKKGEETNGEVYELVRVKATIHLAREEYEEALPIIEELYSIAPDEEYVADTYAVALYACGKIDEMNRVIAAKESTGYQFDEEFHALINGEMTVRDYYVGED